MLTQHYIARCRCEFDFIDGNHRLFIAVPCRLERRNLLYLALLDTAAQWSALPADLARELGCDLEIPVNWRSDPGIITMSSRYGAIQGRVERLTLTLPAIEGDSIDLDVPFFVSPDWDGPLILGWTGFLQSLRFGIDTMDSSLYIGSGTVTRPG